MVTAPAATPLTKPELLTVAVPTAELDHTPLAVALANCVVLPTQTLFVPVIAATTGNGLTVTA